MDLVCLVFSEVSLEYLKVEMRHFQTAYLGSTLYYFCSIIYKPSNCKKDTCCQKIKCYSASANVGYVANHSGFLATAQLSVFCCLISQEKQPNRNCVYKHEQICAHIQHYENAAMVTVE
ncbi:hypothetical protein ILYODFUR_033398 [Ilyodon furcidens]|uniref:Uncharacterized protein n=1 Tax=Ilyodon furcidens TaxID=33524 RepID=A0ABV0TSN5_9TELE